MNIWDATTGKKWDNWDNICQYAFRLSNDKGFIKSVCYNFYYSMILIKNSKLPLTSIELPCFGSTYLYLAN